MLRLRALRTGIRAAVNGGPQPQLFAALERTSSCSVRTLHLAGTEREEVEVGDISISFETGRLARLADGAVVCSSGDTTVMATVVSENMFSDERDFLPLQVDFRERAYALGRIPPTFTRREGTPRDREVLVGRAIDRAIRPLFPPTYFFDTQVIASVLSADGSTDPDVLAINAASAALALSDVPWAGPVGAVRVAIVDGEIRVNPPQDALRGAQLSILYAGTAQRCVMLEARAAGLGAPEADFERAVRAAQAAAAGLVAPQCALAERAGRGKRSVREHAKLAPLLVQRAGESVAYGVRHVLKQGAALGGKRDRGEALRKVKNHMAYQLRTQGHDVSPALAQLVFDSIVRTELRRLLLEGEPRADGRAAAEVRGIGCLAGVVPRVHGSALFERGETQALATVTVAHLDEAQRLDSLSGPPEAKRLMVHYAMPPFSVSEAATRGGGGVSRRETGHGALAEAALAGAMPGPEDFPFCVRVNAETLGSNGSSAMAAVCSGSMALFDCGVPMAAHVAGISVGCVLRDPEDPNPADSRASPGSADSHDSKDLNNSTRDVPGHVLLTDLQGLEDYMGDMDFKVAGTSRGITAAQLDTKAAGGIPLDVLAEALAAARAGRGEVLAAMAAAMEAPREALRASAPRFLAVEVEREMVGRVIGPGGSNIKDLERRSECRFTVLGDQGIVQIAAPTEAALETARGMLDVVLGNATKVGAEYTGVVVSLKEFGAFVELPGGEQGLLHISEVSHQRTHRIEDALKVDQEVQVLVLAKDARGQIKLSAKALQQAPAGGAAGGAAVGVAAAVREDRPMRVTVNKAK